MCLFKDVNVEDSLNETFLEIGFLSSVVRLFEVEKEGDEKMIVYIYT